VLDALFDRLPPLEGRPLHIRFVPDLRAYRGRLLSGGTRGEEVHAGSHLHTRRIVLESVLIGNPTELARILLHELFHFVWVRAGNAWRRSYESMVAGELGAGARGELGWSAEVRKQRLTERDRRARTRRWREYVCESFCDSAACVLGGAEEHEEFTLSARCRLARSRWFREFLARPAIQI
jgi:hypothetical protein